MPVHNVRGIIRSHSFMTFCMIFLFCMSLSITSLALGFTTEEMDNSKKMHLSWELNPIEDKWLYENVYPALEVGGNRNIADDSIVKDRIPEVVNEKEPEKTESNTPKEEANNPQQPEQPEQPQVPKQTEQTKQPQQNLNTSLNNYVLSIIKTYEIGKHPYILNDDYQNYNGVTTNLYFKDKLLLKAHPSGNGASHCTGITFEVLLRAIQERNKKLGIDPNDFNGMSYDQLFDFVMHWYSASGSQKNNIATAVEKYGVGKRVTNLEELRSGDFMQFFRENNTGHVVVFLEWVREENRIVGFKYWSSQESTRGINYKTEYFNITNKSGEKYGGVIHNNIFLATIFPVSQYK